MEWWVHKASSRMKMSVSVLECVDLVGYIQLRYASKISLSPNPQARSSSAEVNLVQRIDVQRLITNGQTSLSADSGRQPGQPWTRSDPTAG
jgi:hypothetical protein